MLDIVIDHKGCAPKFSLTITKNVGESESLNPLSANLLH